MKMFAVALFGHAAAGRRSFSAEDLLLQKASSVSYSADGSGVLAPADGRGITNTDWDFCNKRVTSNLGGLGGYIMDEWGNKTVLKSGTGEKEEIRFHEIGSILTEKPGKSGNLEAVLVDFRVTLVDEKAKKDYKAKTIGENGLKDPHGCIGQINVKAGKKAHVKFALVYSGRDDVVPASKSIKQNFTILDFDRGGNDQGTRVLEEVVLAKGFDNINDTRMEGEELSDGWYRFEVPPGKSYREVYDEDIALDNLNESQLNATMGLQYKSTNEWEVIFKAAGTGAGRNFLFAGETSSCEGEPVCECMPLSSKKASQDSCYVKWDICGADYTQNDGHLLRYKKVAKLGTDPEDCPGGVFGTGGQELDLIVDNLTSYEAHNENRNGKNECLGVINLKSLTDTKLKFTLVKSGTDEEVPSVSDHPFTTDFNIFDFDQSAAGMQEHAGFTGFNKIHINSNSMRKNVDEADGVTWVHSETPAVENPDTDIRKKLTSDQIKSSFSVSYRGTATWEVVFKADKKEGAKISSRTGGRNFLFSGESCASWRLHKCRCPADNKKIWGR